MNINIIIYFILIIIIILLFINLINIFIIKLLKIKGIFNSLFTNLNYIIIDIY